MRIGNDPNPWNNPTCPGIYSDSATVDCDLTGRYVGITYAARGSNTLAFCEVEAFEADVQ